MSVGKVDAWATSPVPQNTRFYVVECDIVLGKVVFGQKDLGNGQVVDRSQILLD